MFKPSLILGLLACLVSNVTLANRTITDQLNRQVIIPDHIERAVILQHQTLNIAVQLDATKQIVGILDKWDSALGKGFARLAPELTKLATPGDLKTVNIESLLSLKPDVVFVTNYFPQDNIEKITSVGIPVIAISLRKDNTQEASKLNPTLSNEDDAYNEGLKKGIRLIANVFEKQNNGEALINTAFSHRQLLNERLKQLKAEQRVKTYIANPNLETYGSGKYTGLMMQHAGAYNVAAEALKGFQKVSMETVLNWNPDVIFVQDRYPEVVSEITQAAEWKTISAVKNGKVYLMPEYAKAWGYPMPEAIALGELWVAKKLYPEVFADLDLDKMVQDYYQKFYRTNYQDTNAK
ncbi:ABC transporter substrate-binding protein [Pasteurella bettyae]|uniref:Periplasmic-binding protein n=1 Tax=Pasteurella bettyae CCUG 2042 TaxID=1095749 RepID=I3DAU6_9PAST|nr:ABC transporter substrate-binding protein [Pasteurella bettyae]EIJ68839.1 periplasmic-binding protein [Pasteurella bettyae CCUG 2042]SUB20900.1 iron complex transport system substrate-binding protein [Pasteurella bettyae]